MRNIIIVVFLLTLSTGISQVQNNGSVRDNASTDEPVKIAPKATFDQYRVITLQKDTTFVDTSLTIKKEYQYNYLRKDIFGLLPFANEGQTYTVLDNSLKNYTAFPDIGFSGKHFNYLQVDDINYFSVATPLTELYFKTVMGQGQSIDALVALNISERLNVSIAYKGLRSLGKYINQLSSAGNFRFTTSYHSSNNRYFLNFHFTGQDILNGENGGITNLDDFEGNDVTFQNRARLEVYLTDARSFMKGNRVFLDHNFKFNRSDNKSALVLSHQFTYENKYYEYNQRTLFSRVGNEEILRFGEAFVTSGINDQARYNKLYNKVGAIYDNSLLGKFQFFVEDFRYNFYYDKILVLDSGVVPNAISGEVNTIGGQYEYRKNKWNGTFLYSNSVTNQSLSNVDAKLKYQLDEKNSFLFQYQMLNKIPDHIYNLSQSSYINYNWSNNFNNEKINILEATAKTQWVDATLQLSSYDDYLYFSQDASPDRTQLISPKQYAETINYVSLKVSREFKWGKFALDNTFLYQQVDQNDDILNVPQLLTRNTLYFSDYVFKKAMFLQTGFIFNYFSKYYVNDYNPLITEAFVQNEVKIGDFPMLDFFINARIRQTRIFLKAEHFNSGFTGNRYYNAPNYPYRDFMIRFGLVWNFFQ
ncbi:putative porin [Flavobacterium sp. j3]|uniref:Porin n=1 Tax=Flavobacterium aureirubrum TaxID=3133147 RepID=A0ABU9N0E2_9FLAO